MSDRREFIRCSACGLVGLAALGLPGCGGGEAPTDPTNDNPPVKKDSTVVKTDTTSKAKDPPKWEVSGSVIKLYLARVTELASVPSIVVINEASTIVVRSADTTYHAFTAVCTHEGCFVANFSDGKLVCPCHGSTYDLNGNVVVGPAMLPLTKYATAFDAVNNELVVTKSA